MLEGFWGVARRRFSPFSAACYWATETFVRQLRHCPARGAGKGLSVHNMSISANEAIRAGAVR